MLRSVHSVSSVLPVHSLQPVTFLAGENKDEAKRESAKDDEHSRSESMSNSIGQFKCLEHERQKDPRSNNEDPEDCRVWSAKQQRGCLLVNAGGSQMANEEQDKQGRVRL